MKRLAAAILGLALVAGCGTPGSSPAGDGDMDLAAANVPRLVTTADDASAAGTAVNAFGLDLYARIAGGDRNANVVFSPASIAVALAMARAGARGQVAAEMDAVLRDLGSDEHAAWVAALDSALNARTGTFADQAGHPQPVTLRIVNVPFAQRGFALEPAYLEALSARFGAGVRLVDYRAAPEDARVEINAWVSEQTERRIEELLAAGALTPMTRLVLVNAVYLKAAWQLPFFEGATAQAPFTRPDGTTIDVAMMAAQGRLGYAEGDGWRAVELPYVGGKLAMLVIVPEDLAALEGTLDAAVLDAITGSLVAREVTLGLPKFGTETRVELASVLGALGMPTAFTDRADFTGITTQEPLLIDAVIHQANIDVDEKGTEAAAATAVVMRATSMPTDVVELTVDHPFLFALRDLETGAVLFLGRISSPAVRSQ